MTLIFVNRYFYPDHSATSQMLSDLAFALARQGFAVAIITSRLRYDEPGDELAARETVEGVEIHRVWTSRFGRHALLGRAVDYATFYLTSAWEVLRCAKRGDVVVAKTDPPMLGITVRVMARLRGARFVNWLQDLFPEVAVALGMNGRLASTLFAVLKRFRDGSLRGADLNVAIGELMAGRLRELRVAERGIRVIPNWADVETVAPVAPSNNPLRQAWGLGNAFVVGYSGNLGRAHEVATLIEAIGRTQAEAAGADVRWLFIGGGAQYEALRKAVQERGFTRVVFQPYQPRALLGQSLSVADIHLVSLRPELEGLIVPSKFYGVAAAGRAAIFIGAKDGEVARLLATHACGMTVPQGDGAALARTVMECAASRDETAAMGTRARAVAVERFGLKPAVAAWEAALEALGAKR